MRIYIEGNYYISGSGMDYTLEQEVTVEKGKGKGNIRIEKKYYPSVSSCMKALLKLKISESTATDLKGLIADVARIEADLKELIQF